MKKFSASVCTLAIAALLGSSLSFADDHDRRDEDRHGHGHGHSRQWEDQRFDQRDGRWNERRPDYNARGPEFHRGGYISREYRDRAYEVDYREHRLSRPPRGPPLGASGRRLRADCNCHGCHRQHHSEPLGRILLA